MAQKKNSTPRNTNLRDGDSHSRRMYWKNYYDNLYYLHHTAPTFSSQHSEVGRRNGDHSSTDLDPMDRKTNSYVSKGRIAVTVAAVVTICAIITAIIVAVYCTRIPDKRGDSKAIIRKIQVTRLKTYQGDVGIAKEWNENLTDPTSPVYKQEANNFISAMNQIYGNSPYKNSYNGTVVDGFRSGSTIIICRILWSGIYIQEIETSATSINDQKGKVISEVEINPLDTNNLIKLIMDLLPGILGTNLTTTPVLQVMMTTIAPVTTEKATTSAPITSKSTTSTKAASNQTTSMPSGTTTIVTPERNINITSTTMLGITSTSTAPKTSTNTATTPTSIPITPNSTASTEPTTATQPTTILTASKSTTTITTSNLTSTSTTATNLSITSTTPLQSTTAKTLTSIPSTTTQSNSTFVSTSTRLPFVTNITTSTPVTTSSGTTQIPGSTSTTTTAKSTVLSTITPITTTTMRSELTTSLPEELGDSVACHFENAYQCGYINIQPDFSWILRSGHFFKLPQYDHTYGNDKGQFMVAYNNVPLDVYYNKIGLTGPEYPFKINYLKARLSSPKGNFSTESCVYFYYYLNGTAVRPNPLSAQLYVYVNGSTGIRLEWYDHINRTVSGWLKGWVSVQPGYANVIFEAKTVTATTIWPGVVTLDDVSITSGSCPPSPDCGRDTFRCNTTRVCIPVDMQCDGGDDCLDGSDEENCTNNPDYQVKLINGDGSYGSIAVFYQGLWRPVCMPKYRLSKGNTNIVQLACQKMGYKGRFQGAFVNSWHQPVQFAMEISCSYDNVDISNCSMNLTQTTVNNIFCYYYQAAFCSNDDCFSGEKLCPSDPVDATQSFKKKCISLDYFCDGIPDCPGGTDELNCANCSTSEFECTNHKCIPSSQRCDGIPQCGDKSDEYGCVIVANNISQIYHSNLSAYLPVCYNNTNIGLANILCSLSGQGSSTFYQSSTYGQGTVLTAGSNATTFLVPGYNISIEPCFYLFLQCATIECGTTIFDDKKLSKILHGRDAVLGQLPWQIALYKDGLYICGGSIIHPNWVLTAAHCTNESRTYSVRVGAVEFEDYSYFGSQGRLYSSLRKYIHPYYNKADDNDISLLYISEPIVYSDYVRPICIASRTTTEEILNAGHNSECYVSGWGSTQEYINRDVWLGKLKMVRVQLYPREECIQLYYNAYKIEYIHNITVCVDNQNFGAPTCSGDSGGTLVCRNKYGRLEILGTLSWGYETCFKDGYPDVYQLSYPHAKWIEEITGLSFSDLTMDID